MSTTHAGEEISMNAQAAAEQPPEIAGTYALTHEKIESFFRDGHIKLNGVFTPEEIEAYRHHSGGSLMTTARKIMRWSRRLQGRERTGSS